MKVFDGGHFGQWCYLGMDMSVSYNLSVASWVTLPHTRQDWTLSVSYSLSVASWVMLPHTRPGWKLCLFHTAFQWQAGSCCHTRDKTGHSVCFIQPFSGKLRSRYHTRDKTGHSVCFIQTFSGKLGHIATHETRLKTVSVSYSLSVASWVMLPHTRPGWTQCLFHTAFQWQAGSCCHTWDQAEHRPTYNILSIVMYQSRLFMHV